MRQRVSNQKNWCALAALSLICACGCYFPYEEHPESFVEHPPSASAAAKAKKKAALPGPSIEFVVHVTEPHVKGKWSGLAAVQGQPDPRVWLVVTLDQGAGKTSVGTVLPQDDFTFLRPDAPQAWSGGVTWTRDAGRLELHGRRDQIKYEGDFIFEPNTNFARQASSFFASRADGLDLFKLMLLDVRLAELGPYAHAGLQLSAIDLCALKEFNVTPGYLAAVLKGGNFTVEDVKLLHSSKVPENYPLQCAASGRQFNARDLVLMANYGVPPSEVVGWSKSVYPYGPAEIAKLHSRGVTPEFGLTAIQAFGRINGEEMIKLRSFEVTTNYLAEIAAAGLTFEVQQVIQLKTYGLAPAEISTWKKAPNAFGVEDMVRLHTAGVPPEFATALNSTNFGVADLIRFKSTGVTPDEAAQWLGAGYPFNTSDLIKLHMAKVPASYGKALYIPGRLHLSSDRIMLMWREGLSAEEIRRRRE